MPHTKVGKHLLVNYKKLPSFLTTNLYNPCKLLFKSQCNVNSFRNLFSVDKITFSLLMKVVTQDVYMYKNYYTQLLN